MKEFTLLTTVVLCWYASMMSSHYIDTLTNYNEEVAGPIFLYGAATSAMVVGAELRHYTTDLFAAFLSACFGLVGFNDPDDIIGKRDQDLPWRDAADQPILVLQRWDEDVVNDDFIINRHLSIPLKNSEWIIGMNKTPLPDENDNVIGIAGFFFGTTMDFRLPDNCTLISV